MSVGRYKQISVGELIAGGEPDVAISRPLVSVVDGAVSIPESSSPR